MSLLTLALLILAVAAVVSLAAERLRIPYTVALVIAGLVVGNFHWFPRVPVTSEVLLTLLIPPLLFEGGLRLSLTHLRSYGTLIGLLAVAGTLLAAFAVAGVVAAVFHLGMREALLLGAIAAAIDPASVIALMQEARVDVRLATILEGEAVLNDGVAIVLFTVLTGSLSFTPLAATWQFGWLLGAGACIGLLVAGAVSVFLGRTRQPLLEALGSLIAVLGSLLAAEGAGASGIVAVAIAGVVFGHHGLRHLTEEGRETVRTLWDVIAFLMNSVLFLLIGLEVPMALLARHWFLIVVVASTALAVRAVVVYGFSAARGRSASPVPVAWQHLLVWGGLRGGVAIALVLGLAGSGPVHETIAAGVFGLVVFTLLGQGLSMQPVMRRMGLITAPRTQTV